MQHLNTLWQIVGAAQTVSDVARPFIGQQQSYLFNVSPTGAITLFLRADNAEVRVTRWLKPQVEVVVRLQVPLGWRIATDQDEAGVYVVAKRKRVVGGMSSASFTVNVPQDAYLMLELENGRVMIDNINGALHSCPPDAKGRSEVK